MRSSPSPASTAPTISRWAPRGDGRDSGADNASGSIRLRWLGPWPACASHPRVRRSWTRPSGADLDARVCLEHLLAGLAGADAHGILDGKKEDLPVADLPGPAMPQDRVDDHRGVAVLDHALHLQLRPEVDRDRRSAVVLRDALLAPGSLHLTDRQA